MSEDIYIPRIASVESGIQRPLWSVMIPTYNCANYLRETLESVLSQDPGPEYMQIEVIDDCSTKDDPEKVVWEVGRGRVDFSRQWENVGATKNFNTCVSRSTGRLIHILHGDDIVFPDFYKKISECFEIDDNIGAVVTRAIIINENSAWISINELLTSYEGIINDFLSDIYIKSFILTPGIVIRRSIYEHIGGFNENLSHTTDWEMWIRAALNSKIYYIPHPLSGYRVHSLSDTSKLTTKAENIREIRKAIFIARDYVPKEISDRLTNKALQVTSSYSMMFLKKYAQEGKVISVVAHSVEAIRTYV